jgi:tripartite-type tricarboxylate transporter receptor subunit TctC
MEYYKRANGVDPVHVPYKGGAPALQEVMGGQVQLMIALVPEAMPMVKGGRLRALAVTSNKRLAGYPDLPTVAESGGQDLDVTFWYGFVAPTGTPPAIVTKLNQVINQILVEKDVQAKLAEMNLDVVGGAPAQLTALIKSDAARWKKVIDDAGIKVD